jgi:hypothetical protein
MGRVRLVSNDQVVAAVRCAELLLLLDGRFSSFHGRRRRQIARLSLDLKTPRNMATGTEQVLVQVAPGAPGFRRGLAPVVIAISDVGVDAALFPGRVWTNAKEVPGNGKNDDGNGYVDDVHGIAWAWDGEPNCRVSSSGRNEPASARGGQGVERVGPSRHRRILERRMRWSLRGPTPHLGLRSCNLSADTAVLASEVG